MDARRAHAIQNVVTVVTPIVPDRLGHLEETLQALGDRLRRRPHTSPVGPLFPGLDTVHFLRWAVLPAARDASGAPIAAELVLASCFDGPVDAHLHALVRTGGADVAAIYADCTGYDPGGGPGALVAYLRAHVVPAAACYIACMRRPVERVHAEHELRWSLEAVVDEQVSAREMPSAPALVGVLREHVRRSPSLAWALTPPASPPRAWYVRHYGRLAGLALLALVLSPLLVPALVALRVLLWRAERGEGAPIRAPIDDDSKAALDHLAALVALEDPTRTQNELTHVSPLTPGRLRMLSLRVLCWVLQLRASYLDTHGSFGGITTIHFAHWNVIDGGRRLLFCTNYDGTWESYLDQFIDRAASALTAVWSHCIDFPATRLLVMGGARDEDRFKAWFRRFQVPTNVWYTAYPHLSVQNVLNNSAIRAGLAAGLEPREVPTWLRRF